ncbi:complexin-3-like [Rhinophrynus dorsalis]
MGFKSIFGDPSKSMSCWSAVGFPPEHRPHREERSGWNIKGRWSSEDQHHKELQAEMNRRDSFYAQKKAERAMMREHIRGKYHLPKNSQDEQQVRAAGGSVQMPRELRLIIQPEEPGQQGFSILGFLGHQSLDLGFLKKSPHSAVDSLQPGKRCVIM